MSRVWRTICAARSAHRGRWNARRKLNLLIAALASGDYVLCFDDFQIAADVPDIAYIFKQIRQRFVELQQPLPARFIIMGRAFPPDLEYLVPESLRGLTQEDDALPDRSSA